MRRVFAVLATLLASAAVLAQEEELMVPDVVQIEGNIFAEVLILFGCFFILVSAIGMVRFPDVYTRLHSSTKLVALGGIGIFGGAALAFLPIGATERVLLIGLFFFMTAPVAGYMISRSSYLMGLPLYREEVSIDAWGAHGEMAEASMVEDDEDDPGEVRGLPPSGDSPAA